MESEATRGKTFLAEREEKLNDAVKDFFIAGDCDGILELIKKEKIYSFFVQPFLKIYVKYNYIKLKDKTRAKHLKMT